MTVLCEPQLGKRGLYPTTSQKGSYDDVKAMTNFIAYADGTLDLLEISEIIEISVSRLHDIAIILEKAGLLEKINETQNER